VLRAGRLRAFIYSPDSREATLFTLREGELSVLALKDIRESCGVELCFEVMEPSELLCVHENALFVLSHTVPRVQQELLSASFSHLNALLRAVNVQAFYPLRKRLALLLLERAEQTGSDTIFVTHEELARALRGAREMVSVEIESMRRAGLLAASRGKIRILDKAGLEQEARLSK
jgi:CRP/FNR family transcriptional regulator